MKKKFLSILLCLCMMMALLPTTALAGTYADDDYQFRVRVAGQTFGTSESSVTYWTCSGTELSAVTAADNWNVKYDPTTSGAPTVTLKDFTFEGTQNAIRSQGALNIVFEGTNVINNTKTSSSDAVDSFELHGIMVKGDLTITGTSGAKLTVTSSNGNAIEANDFAAENDTRYDETLTIKNANITATGYGLGIGSTENLIIENSTIISTGNQYHGLQGGFYDTEPGHDFGKNGSITITNSTITAASTSGTAINIEPTFTGNYLWKANEAGDWQTLSDSSKPYYSNAKTVLLKPGQPSVTSVTYPYAYDVQRTPNFPASVGAAITANPSTNSLPLKPNSGRYDSNQGPWTLTEVGYYSEKDSFNPTPNTYLNGVVGAVAGEYGLDADDLMIHKLTDKDNTHVAYGVVIAVDETNEYALFVGDLWNSGGAGYLLSNTEITADSVTFNAQQVAQSKYSISLSPTTVTFDGAQTGYTVPAAQTITVTNTGDDATGALTVELTAGATDAFEVLTSPISSITNPNGTATFTVQPKTGLSAGTYTATVTVSGNKVMPVTATVSFKVSSGTPATYTVTWMSQNGTQPLETDANVTSGTRPSFGSEAPTKADDDQYTYTFAGWATTANAESGTAVGSLPAVTGNVTYYAAFSKTARSYEVTLNPGEGASCDALTSYTVGIGATLPTPTKAGYTFGGWYDNSGFNGDAVTEISATDTGDKTFYAKWIRNSGSSGVSTYPISVDSAENGDVTSSHKTAAKGTTITLTVEPDKGYTLETLTVTDKNGDEIELTNKGDGKYTFTMPASKVYVEATFMEDNSMLNFFVDVFPGDYYYDAVLWAAKNGITDGVDAAHFAPNASCTRAQIVTFLWRAAGCPAPKSSTMPFTDVKAGSYYETAVLWAVENGITKGTGDTTFSPNATCSRAQIVSFLYRAASSPAVSGSAVFTDVSAGSYYANAVAWAVENGITGGTGNNAFSPNADCTRAQIVSFLYRWMVK